MWVSRLIRGPWSYLKGLASASSQGCAAQTAGFVAPRARQRTHLPNNRLSYPQHTLLSNPRPAPLLFCCLWKCTAPSAPIGCQVLPRWSRQKRSSRPGEKTSEGSGMLAFFVRIAPAEPQLDIVRFAITVYKWREGVEPAERSERKKPFSPYPNWKERP